jgi:hypothetical protein
MDCSFFGLQLVLRPLDGAAFHAELRRLISDAPAEQTLGQKRYFYTKLHDLLALHLDAVELGYWDYIGDVSRAENEFETWCSEIEAVVRDPQPAREEVSPYYIVSVAFLSLRNSNSDTTLGERCDIAEPQFWTRQTLAHLVATLPMLNFSTISADAVYLVPGHAGEGPTSDELRSEGYEYLHPIV